MTSIGGNAFAGGMDVITRNPVNSLTPDPGEPNPEVDDL
jgi:hypothetical protein